MRVFLLRTLLPIVCLLCLPVLAQDKDAVRVGVAVLRSGTEKVSVNEARDRLVKALNQQKPDKKRKLRVQAVPLEASQGNVALAEAKGKDCQFVLFSHLTDLLTSEKSVPSSMTGTIDTFPVFAAKVECQLERVVDSAEYAVGSARSEDASSMKDAVMDAMSQVAGAVFAELKKGRNVPHRELAPEDTIATQKAPAKVHVAMIGTDFCKWLPTDIPHSEALHGVCEFAMSLPQRMPNFICDQQTSRYRGDSKVPRDLITALVQYEDGNESYSEIKLNGKAAPSAINNSPGQWSTGEFGSNLRAIFDLHNQALFEFSGVNTLNGHAAWLFTYRIAKQNDPLWRLRTVDRVIAPPYDGELWVDQKTGDLLRFRSVATEIPKDFPTQSADLQTDYNRVAFADGSSFPLPVDAAISTRQQGEEERRNVLQFRNCHKFRAKTRMLLDAPASLTTETAVAGSTSPEGLQRQSEESNQIYAILREEAVREDDARLQAEQAWDVNAFAGAVRQRMAALEAARQKHEAALEASAKLEAAKEATPPATKEGLTTLKVSVKLVQVSVLLRDAKGHAVGSLKKEDFQLFDNGKPQVISSFSAEKAATTAGTEKPSAATSADSLLSHNNAPESAGRDVAYVFDDIHTTFSDLSSATAAAARHLAALRPEGRAAIFTTSGQRGLNFTADRQRLQDTLKSLRPHPLTSGAQCPPMTSYMADLIVNQDDRETLGMATQDAINCSSGGMAHTPAERARAEQIARATAFEVLATTSSEIQSTLGILREVVQRTSATPGGRSIVLVSPGFLTQTVDTRQALAELIDGALRSDIVVNTLDVRGLSTPVPAPNANHPSNAVERSRLDREEALERSDVLADLAYSTGGTFFHNNNDLDEGFRRTADTPEYIYVLGFSPQKLDGKFHKLKVSLNGPEKFTVQARQGYYALKPTASP
ncbi:MAG TPA: VWA domain-containing protein [Candidatus Sulfotelmatobacter sp.]